MSVTLVGNLTRDPELRFTKSGLAMLTLGLAVTRRRNEQESTSFFDVVAFGGLAENAAESLVKGTRVVVVGRLEQRSWETDSGDRRSKVEVIADEVSPSLRWAHCTVDRIPSDISAPRAAPAPSGPGPGASFDLDTDPF